MTDGLIFQPSAYSPPVGYAGFNIELTDHPAPRYFDARRALFPVEDGGVMRLQAVEHPWNGPAELRFAIGRIRLDAHDGDHEEIYGFGGVATVTAAGAATVCQVTSTAPFLPLNDDPHSAVAALESELEVILARSRAGWGSDEYAHLDRLSHIDPLLLFASSLAAVERRLAPMVEHQGEESLRGAWRMARAMRERLAWAGDWPETVRPLEELL